MKICIITVVVAILLIMATDYVYSMEKNRIKLRKRFMKGFFKAIIMLVTLNICLYQFEAGRSIQAYLVKNVAFIVAIFSFTMQQVLSDVIGGLMIAIYRPYEVGERVNIVSKDITGVIEDITVRHTVVKCYDNSRLVIPNSVINKEILKNADYEDCLSGNFVEVYISFDSDIDKAMCLMEEIIMAEPLTLYKGKKEGVRKELNVQASRFSKDGICLKAVIWTTDTDSNFAACSNIRKEIIKRFTENDIRVTA